MTHYRQYAVGQARGNEFVTVKSLNRKRGQPVGVEIFIIATISRSNPTFMHAVLPPAEDDKTWIRHSMNHQKMAEWQRNAGKH